jgi:hypothetical protein
VGFETYVGLARTKSRSICGQASVLDRELNTLSNYNPDDSTTDLNQAEDHTHEEDHLS